MLESNTAEVLCLRKGMNLRKSYRALIEDLQRSYRGLIEKLIQGSLKEHPRISRGPLRSNEWFTFFRDNVNCIRKEPEPDTCFLQCVLNTHAQHPQAVLYTPFEVDGRSFVEVFGRTGNFSDLVAFIEDLGQYLIVKNEIIRIVHKRYRFQY